MWWWSLSPVNTSRRIPSPLRSTKKFPSGWGLVFCLFCRDTSKWSIHEVKTTKRSKSTGNKFEILQRWRPESWRNFCGFPRRFVEVFFALSTPHEFRSNSKGNKKNPVFIVFLGLKDFGGFKDRQERVSRKHWPPYGPGPRTTIRTGPRTLPPTPIRRQ